MIRKIVITKQQAMREQLVQLVIDFLGYATSSHRTLRSCGIRYCDIVNILRKMNVIDMNEHVPFNKYKPDLTIDEFINMIVNEYAEEGKIAI